MKKFAFLFLLSISTAFAQKELWGVNDDYYVPLSFDDYYGNITKYDINGTNSVKMHEFNISDGRKPTGKLFQASNGKIYGTTFLGGTTFPFAFYGAGVLFEYDPILNKYFVIYYFDFPNNPESETLIGLGVIEPVVGMLYGVNLLKPFSYNILTGEFLISNTIAPFAVVGELVDASNGFLYGTTYSMSPCPDINPLNNNNGTIFRINKQTLDLQIVYRFNCSYIDGLAPTGNLILVSPGKLYGTAIGGGSSVLDGTLYEFDINTNIFTKKIDFESDILGRTPRNLVNGGNGKLYGVCQNGGINIDIVNGEQITKHDGTLFEYTIETNTIVKLHDFGYDDTSQTYSANNPISLMKTSNGYYIGTANSNPFKFDPSNNTVVNTLTGSIPFNTNRLLNFIEICRKPSYQEFLPNTYAPEVGSTFTFDLQNDNATSFVWKKGTTILPSQTSGVLNIANITLADTGVYTCTMTNECGETVTMNLNINVTNLATETIDDYKKLISLYPNPTKGIINLKFPENRGLKGISYKITNLLGQTMVENIIVSKPNMTELSIDTSSFSTGVYQLSFTTDKGNWYGKFVKE
jgi:hypothetical protein